MMKTIKQRAVAELLVFAYVCILVALILFAASFETAAAIVLIPGFLSSGFAVSAEHHRLDKRRQRSRLDVYE